jgi:hypothetical protein
MKKYFLLIIFAVGLLPSCTDKLEIKPTAYQNIEDALKTADGLKSLRNSSYAYARQVYGRYFYHFAELLADTGEITFMGTYEELRDLSNKSLVSTFPYGEAAWQYAYRAINGCNLILDNLDVVEDEADRAQLEGDARFIRGTLYFDLVRFFALPYGTGAMSTKAVPLNTVGIVNPDGITFPSKATVQQVFDLVEDDLKKASELLSSDEMFYANRYSALAILSRLYLTTEDYLSAATVANQIIDSNYFSLVSTPFLAFNQKTNCSEDIISWQQTELDNEGEFNDGMTPFYASTDAVGRSEMVISEDFIANTYDPDDLRGKIQYGLTAASEINSAFYEGFGQRARGIYTSKWLDYKTNITFVRLAEMYLTRAEANYMILDNGGAQVGTNSPTDDIAAIRERAGLDVSGMADVTLEEIHLERYKELIFEGHRLHDYKRWKVNIGEIIWDSDRLIIPTPKKETDTNPNL